MTGPQNSNNAAPKDMIGCRWIKSPATKRKGRHQSRSPMQNTIYFTCGSPHLVRRIHQRKRSQEQRTVLKALLRVTQGKRADRPESGNIGQFPGNKLRQIPQRFREYLYASHGVFLHFVTKIHYPSLKLSYQSKARSLATLVLTEHGPKSARCCPFLSKQTRGS